jgi:transposase
MFARVKTTEGRRYLQIVETRREGGRIRQRLVASLGRLEDLKAGGDIDGLMSSLSKFSENLAILDARREGRLDAVETLRVGPPLLFRKIWDVLGIPHVLGDLLKDRHFEFPVERAVFLTVIHRLMVSGSDRAAEMWRDAYAFDDEVKSLDLHHLYRTMAWLGEELPEEEQDGATPFAPRCIKDVVEERLFKQRRDLFTEFDLVFFDTTSIYFEGEGGESIGEWGHSKDHRPDLKQMVVGVILDSEGNPVCSEMWPGSTTDVTTLIPVVDRLRLRFGIRRVCVVADRGMISEKTIAELEKPERGLEYILGARMRVSKEVREDVLSRGGRYAEVHPTRKFSKDPSPLRVKEVRIGDRRYVVCHNEEQARKDRADREAILSALSDALKKGDKSLVGNKGYRKYLKAEGPGFSIDESKAQGEERFDGKWVLRTNTDLPAADVALKYKQLWTVEQAFRTMKSILGSRPIWHKHDETIRGHVFCSFLALLMMKRLQDALESRQVDVEWDELLRQLDKLEEVRIETEGKRFLIRSDASGTVVKAFQAAGAALPPRIRRMDSE